MHAALQDKVSRYGRASGHGNGFRDLFLGLAHLNADLWFRSGGSRTAHQRAAVRPENGAVSAKDPAPGFPGRRSLRADDAGLGYAPLIRPSTRDRIVAMF